MLPEEIIQQILALVDLLDLLRCRAVSRSFRSTIDASPRLQLRIELYTSCLPAVILDVSGIGTADYPSQIAYLRRLRRNWSLASPHGRLTLDDFSVSCPEMHHRGSGPWDSPNDHQQLGHTLSQPLVLLGRTIAMPCMVPHPSAVTDRMGFDALKFMRLPLFGSDSQSFHALEKELFAHHSSAFVQSGMLASSMFINYFDGWMAITDTEEHVVCLHIRTFPGNVPYPGIARPVMEWTVQRDWAFTIMDTVGDHIAIAASSATTQNPIVTSPFIVWNWKTGIPLLEGEAGGYLFLNRDTLLLLQFDASCSKYYLEIVEICPRRSNGARFYLPSLRGARRYTHMHFTERAESIDNDHGVQLIGISALTQSTNSDGSTATHDLMFFISGPRLLNLYQALSFSSRQQEKTLLWHEWGSNRGRCIASPAISRDGPTVCGTRGVLSIRWPKSEFGFTSDLINSYRLRSPVQWTDKYFMILDFNPFILKESYGGAGGLNIDTHVVSAGEDPALSVAQELFSTEDVGEGFPQIPYRVTMSREPLGGSHIVPWEGGLVHWRKDKQNFEVWRF